MNIRDEINNIIAANCYTVEDNPADSVIMGDDFGKLEDDLVKFCNLQRARNQRVLLIAFLNWYHKQENHQNELTINRLVDVHLKQKL